MMPPASTPASPPAAGAATPGAPAASSPATSPESDPKGCSSSIAASAMTASRLHCLQQQLELRPHDELVVGGGQDAGLRLVGRRAVGQVAHVQRQLRTVDILAVLAQVIVHAAGDLVERVLGAAGDRVTVELHDVVAAEDFPLLAHQVADLPEHAPVEAAVVPGGLVRVRVGAVEGAVDDEAVRQLVLRV